MSLRFLWVRRCAHTTCNNGSWLLAHTQEAQLRIAAEHRRQRAEQVREQERLLEEARAAMSHEPTQPLPDYSSASMGFDWDEGSEHEAAYAASMGLDDLIDTEHGVWWAPGAFPGLRPFHWLSQEPMEQLGLPHGAPLSTVKARYRKLALALHPDKHKDEFPAATAAFIAVTKAYKVVHAKLKPTPTPARRRAAAGAASAAGVASTPKPTGAEPAS